MLTVFYGDLHESMFLYVVDRKELFDSLSLAIFMLKQLTNMARTLLKMAKT